MKLDYKNKIGMSLVEVMVAIAPRGIISRSVLPMLVLSTKSNKQNEIKMNAMNIAYSQMEWIKGLKYEDIGYKPNGEIEKNKYMNEKEIIIINGIEYTINTNITWQKATSLLQGEIGEAVKKVEVTVYLRNNNDECATLDTLITYEHEGKPQEPGNLYVYAFMKNNSIPVDDIKIKLKNSNISKEIYTNREGLAPFGNLSDGEYTLIPEIEEKLIMFEPTEVEDNNYLTSRIVNINKDSREEKFYGEYPVFLKTDLNNLEDLYIWLQPDENSVTPPEDTDLDEYMKVEKSLDSINNTKLWWKWKYKYGVFQQNNDNKYFLIDKKSNELWIGTFEEPRDKNNTKEVYIGVGLNPESNVENFNLNGDRQMAILLEFSAPVKIIDEIQFSINDVPIENEYEIQNIDNGDYSKEILIKFNEKVNNLTIDDNSMIEITNPEVLVDEHGIKLAKCLNKSVFKIMNEE